MYADKERPGAHSARVNVGVFGNSGDLLHSSVPVDGVSGGYEGVENGQHVQQGPQNNHGI